MKNNKKCLLSVILIFLVVNIQPAVGVNNNLVISVNYNEVKDSHIIENVPYVSQETGFYCAYASAAMIFKYYGINTSLDEVLFITGAGSSLAYNFHINSLMAGVGITRNFTYIAGLYNLSINNWGINITGKTKEYCLDEYWIRVKENISNNYPVWTYANPFQLKSVRDLRNIPDFIMDKIPSSHTIVVVGYNESNSTICFNDPIPGIIGENEKGTYIWMDLNDYKNAVWSAGKLHEEKIKSMYAHISIVIFNKISDAPSKELFLKEVYFKNIERIKGNFSAYDGDGINDNLIIEFKDFLGINALEKFKDDFGPDFINRLSQILTQKRKNIGKPILILIGKLLKLENFINETFGRPYTMILSDKELQYKFLVYNIDILNISNEELTLYKEEVEYWKELFTQYYLFMKKGLRLNIFIGMEIIIEIYKNIDNIISIQHELINTVT